MVDPGFLGEGGGMRPAQRRITAFKLLFLQKKKTEMKENWSIDVLTKIVVNGPIMYFEF